MTNPQRIGTDLGEKKVLADINEYGWHCMNVIEDDGHPPWSFTIGLFETWSHPELIVIGRSRTTSHAMLTNIVGQIEANKPVDLTDLTDYLLLGIPCRFLEVLPRYYSDYVGFARWYYRKRDFPLYQIVWSNDLGDYPWSPLSLKSFREWQPVLSSAIPTCATGEPHGGER
jgi:Domain of unknown function (DUF4262)